MEIFRESNKYSCFYDLFKKRTLACVRMVIFDIKIWLITHIPKPAVGSPLEHGCKDGKFGLEPILFEGQMSSDFLQDLVCKFLILPAICSDRYGIVSTFPLDHTALILVFVLDRLNHSIRDKSLNWLGGSFRALNIRVLPDTKELYQENNVQGRIVVKSPDTDILVLLVHYFPNMKNTSKLDSF
jgi:hypothetical protein